MELNDNKAGMEGLEKEKINAIIQEASKNSRFFQHQQKRDVRIKEKIEQQKKVFETFTPDKLRLAELQTDRLVEELESQRDLSQTVVHLDMDAFYAAVEMRDDPSLRNKPLGVGSTSMLSTSNYVARKFGVRAAQPGFIGKKLCPDLIIVPCNFEKYTKCSEIVREKIQLYDPNFVPMGLDEAYLNLTDYLERIKLNGSSIREHRRIRYSGDCRCRLPYDESLNSKNLEEFDEIREELCKKCLKSRKIFIDPVSFTNNVHGVVEELRFQIEQATGLTASAGIAVNAMLAKVCSDKNKPNGQFYLPPDRETIMNFIKVLPIRKVGGIGGVTEAMLKGLGIQNCHDLFEKRTILSLLYSKISTKFFLKVSMGLGSSMFEYRDSDRKSISVERTFSEINNPEHLQNVCHKLCEKLADDVQEEEVKGRTVSLKLKTVDFQVRTRAQSSDVYVADAQALYKIAREILQIEIKAAAPELLRLRLLGVRLSNLVSKNEPDGKKLENLKEITEFFKPISVTDEKSNDACESTSSIFYSNNEDSNDCIILSDTEGKEDSTANCVSEIVEHSGCESACDSVTYMCPVCNIKQRTIKNLSAFNDHVDHCLSRKTIVDIEKNEKGKSTDISSSNNFKRKSAPKVIPSSGSKRPNRTLDDFFHKK